MITLVTYARLQARLRALRTGHRQSAIYWRQQADAAGPGGSQVAWQKAERLDALVAELDEEIDMLADLAYYVEHRPDVSR